MFNDKNEFETIRKDSRRRKRGIAGTGIPAQAAAYAGVAAVVLIIAAVFGRGGKKPEDPAAVTQAGAAQAGSQEETTR